MDAPHLHIAIDALLAPSSERGCLLVVGINPQGLDLLAMSLAARHGWEDVSVGSELGALLLGVCASDRPRVVQRWARDRLGPPSHGPRLCNRLDLLFEPTLALDPLRMLRQAGRSAGIIAMWPGSYADGVLAYAMPEHANYRTWSRPEVAVVMLGETG